VAQVELTDEEIACIWKMLNQVSVQGLDSMQTVLGIATKLSNIVTASANGVPEPTIPRK
jgi:hypothetical protein